MALPVKTDDQGDAVSPSSTWQARGMDHSAHYRERLFPPIWVWVASLLIAFIFAWAFKAGLGWFAGIAVFAVTGTGVVVGLLKYSLTIEVADDELRVGNAHIDWYYVGRVATLDHDSTNQAKGPKSDPRAFHLLRPLSANESITIEVLDDEDPHPYWLISTRNPSALAQAVAQSHKIPS